MLRGVRSASNDTGTTHQSGSNIVDNIAIQIRCNHDVELVGVAHQLHRGIIYNHFLKLRTRVQLGNL